MDCSDLLLHAVYGMDGGNLWRSGHLLRGVHEERHVGAMQVLPWIVSCVYVT